jgi:hypothetical protein
MTQILGGIINPRYVMLHLHEIKTSFRQVKLRNQSQLHKEITFEIKILTPDTLADRIAMENYRAL